MPTAHKLSALLSDALGTLFVRAIGILLMFVSTTLTARLLGPVEYGAYSASLALSLLLASLAPLGTDRILVRNLSTVKSTDEAGQETAIAHVCTAIITLLLLLICLSVWLVCSTVADNQQWAQTSLLASIMFLPLTIIFLRQWVAIPLLGTRRAVLPEQTVLPIVFTASILVIAATGFRLTALTTAAVNAAALLLIWFGCLVARPLRAAYRSAWNSLTHAAPSAVGRRLLHGLPFVSVAIGAVWTQSCMPLFVAAICGLEEAAFFALAMPFAALPCIPLGAFNLSVITRCAQHFQKGEFAEANHTVRSAATATFALSAAIGIVTWMASPLITELLGEQYSMVRRLLPPLLLASIVDCLTGPTIPVMQTMQMQKAYTRALIVFMPVQLLMVSLYGRFAGIEGAATAYLLSRCLWNIVVVAMIRHTRGLVMLPYLRVSLAMQEWSTFSSLGIGSAVSTRNDWTNSPIVSPGEAARAA